MKRLGTVWVCVALLGVACGEESTPSTPPPPPPVVEPPATPTPEVNSDVPEPSPVGQVMRGHFSRAADARDALIRGDLPTARENMTWLATHRGGDTLPANLRPYFDQMQSEAGHFSEATTLTEAGTALARTLNRCGECHSAGRAGPLIATPPLPEGEEVADAMQRHRWAAERMWEGLVVNDPGTYRAGAAALREASLHESEIAGAANNPAPPERVRAIAASVHDLGDRATSAPDNAERANVYGRLLATCATCHRLLGVGDTVAEGEGVVPAAEGATAPAPHE